MDEVSDSQDPPPDSKPDIRHEQSTEVAVRPTIKPTHFLVPAIRTASTSVTQNVRTFRQSSSKWLLTPHRHVGTIAPQILPTAHSKVE
jgi:hypothetical protein